MNLTAHPLAVLAELTWNQGARAGLRPRKRALATDTSCAPCGGPPQPSTVKASHHRNNQLRS
jgi:hypothetical protein